jgi:colanic acid/amylovoran biosynthesis protein
MGEPNMTMGAGATAGAISIGLLWHSVNSGNLGVGALTISNLLLARQAAAAAGLSPHFRVLGFVDPGVTPYVAGDDIDVLPLNARAMIPGGTYWRALANLDCILDIGGGDSFTDIYGPKRFGYLWLTKAMAIARRVPLALSPQTIGPFTHQPQTWLAAEAMKRTAFVVARDPMSLEVSRQMAPGAHVIQAVDVAFALPFKLRTKSDDSQIEIGLNVSGLLFNGGYSGANEFGMQVDYAAYTRRLITTLLERPNVSVQLICHVNSDALPQDDDGRVADRLATEFPGVVRVPDFPSPSAAKSYISGLDFLVAGRMHACIAAFSSRVPVVPVAYSRKFTGLFDGVLGYPHLVPVHGLDTDGALAFTLDRIERQADLRADIARGQLHIEALLERYKVELAGLFSRVAHGQAT